MPDLSCVSSLRLAAVVHSRSGTAVARRWAKRQSPWIRSRHSFSWTDFTSLEGATEAMEAIKDGTHSGLQECITDIYMMGIEDGRVLEREVY